MRFRPLLLTLLILAPIATYADIGRLRGGPVGGCVYTGADDNGCAAAPANGSLLHTNFFTSYALQSGQTFVTRPPFNVAGVDYAVGAPTTGTYCDVSNAGVCAAGGLPTGCTYSATGSNSGNPAVTCGGTNNPVFDHWDFNASGTNCTMLNTNGTFNGTLTVQNSKFRWDSKCNGTAASSGAFIYWYNNNNQGITITSSTFDGCPLAVETSCWEWQSVNNQSNSYIFYGSASVITSPHSTPMTFTYNAFLRTPLRFIATGTFDNGDVNVKYNYFEGIYPPQAKFTGTIDNGAGVGSGGTAGSILCPVAGSFAYGNLVTSDYIYQAGLAIDFASITGPGTACPGGTTSWTVSGTGWSAKALGPVTFYATGSNHGDTFQFNLASSATRNNYNVIGNTNLFTPLSMAGSGAWTMNFSGGAGSTFTNTVVDRNTTVHNITAANSRGMTSAAIFFSPATTTYTNTTITNNYAGTTGLTNCINLLPSSGVTISGNIVLENGGSWNAAGSANCPGHY